MSYNNAVLIKACEQHIESIRDIMLQSFGQYVKEAGIPTTVKALTESYDDILNDINTQHVFVALLDGTVAGTARVNIYMSEEGERCAYFSRFGVMNRYRKNGMGKFIMDEIDKFLQQEGVEKLYLHTASNMTSLMRFYCGRGFYVQSTSDDRGYVRALLCKQLTNEDLIEATL